MPTRLRNQKNEKIWTSVALRNSGQNPSALWSWARGSLVDFRRSLSRTSREGWGGEAAHAVARCLRLQSMRMRRRKSRQSPSSDTSSLAKTFRLNQPDARRGHARHAQFARRANLSQGCTLAPTCQNVFAGSRMPASHRQATLHGVVFDILDTSAPCGGIEHPAFPAPSG
jgi:hypothetical protein